MATCPLTRQELNNLLSQHPPNSALYSRYFVQGATHILLSKNVSQIPSDAELTICVVHVLHSSPFLSFVQEHRITLRLISVSNAECATWAIIALLNTPLQLQAFSSCCCFPQNWKSIRLERRLKNFQDFFIQSLPSCLFLPRTIPDLRGRLFVQ